MRSEKFWIPSKQEKVLFDQLNQKKFREIIKDDLTYVISVHAKKSSLSPV